MRLVLVRHADAEDYAKSDFERKLTAKGKKQSAKVGRFLGSLSCINETVLLHSPYLRAKETAQIIIENSGIHMTPIEDRRAGCGMSVESASDMLEELFSIDTVVLVGHQPDMGDLFSYLLGGHGSVYTFKKACTAIFQLHRFGHGSGCLEAFVPVKLLGDSL